MYCNRGNPTHRTRACASYPPVNGGPAVAVAETAKPKTTARTLTVTITPSTRQSAIVAPFSRATDSATTHGTPADIPRATSAAASAAASAAPVSSDRNTSVRASGPSNRTVAIMQHSTPMVRTEPAPRAFRQARDGADERPLFAISESAACRGDCRKSEQRRKRRARRLNANAHEVATMLTAHPRLGNQGTNQ